MRIKEMTSLDKTSPAAATAKAGRAAAEGRQRLSQSERAYQELKRRILDNEMPAGFQALEQELAELLGMSRTPVREALIRLAKEGIVEVRPRHGMRILPISVADMREIYEILTGLESTAAEIVAERGLDHDSLGTLRRAVEDMDSALADDDLRAWAEADERFHNLLVEFSGNERQRAAACLGEHLSRPGPPRAYGDAPPPAQAGGFKQGPRGGGGRDRAAGRRGCAPSASPASPPRRRHAGRTAGTARHHPALASGVGRRLRRPSPEPPCRSGRSA
ncbi:GntR family transcriptional regulator [Pelagibius sp.]|uniref:GntR family transcriptional regulator n=1 Tax=Pelagibius sp. TaxID=1931238 RepID=UPI003BAB3275